MSWHEDEGVDLPTDFHACLAQCLDETLSVHFILEDGFTPVTATHHMVNRPRILDSQLARLARRMDLADSCVIIKNYPLYRNSKFV